MERYIFIKKADKFYIIVDLKDVDDEGVMKIPTSTLKMLLLGTGFD
jgi:hypothetical protein